MYKGKLNDTRYDDLRNLMKQLVPKEKLGGDQSQVKNIHYQIEIYNQNNPICYKSNNSYRIKL